MQTPAHYETDLLFYFQGKPMEYQLYEALFARICAVLPSEISVKVHRSQISFYGRHLFCAASIPVRRKKGWPAHCLMVTFGLSARLDSPRIAVAAEPYPNRWTHHVLIESSDQIDDELMQWLQQAYQFSQNKR